jgi:hypothetical protein
MFHENAFYPEGVNAPFNIRTAQNRRTPTPTTKPNYRAYNATFRGAEQALIFNRYARDSARWYAKHEGPRDPMYAVLEDVLGRVANRVERREYTLSAPVFERLSIKGILDTSNQNILTGMGNTLRQLPGYTVQTYSGVYTNMTTQNPTKVVIQQENQFSLTIFSNKTVLVNVKSEAVVQQVQAFLEENFGKRYLPRTSTRVFRICSTKKIDIPTLKNCILPPTNSAEYTRFVETYGTELTRYFKHISKKEQDQTRPGQFHFQYKNIVYSVYTNGKIMCSVRNEDNVPLDQMQKMWRDLVKFCEKAGYHIMSSENANPAECAGETKTEVKTAQKKASRDKNLKPYTPGAAIGNKQYVVPATTPTGYAIKNLGKQNPQKKQILDRFKELAPGQFSNINKMIANFGLKTAKITKSDVEEYLKKNKAPEVPANKKPKTNPKEFKGSPPNFNSNRWVIKNNKGAVVKILRPSNKGDVLKEYDAKINAVKLVGLFNKWGKTPGKAVPTVLAKMFKIPQQRPEVAIQTARKEKANKNAKKAAEAEAMAKNKANSNAKRKAERKRIESTTAQQRAAEARKKYKEKVAAKERSKENKAKEEAVPLVKTLKASFGLQAGIEAAKQKLGIKRYSPTPAEKEALERLKKLRNASRAQAAAAKGSAAPTYTAQRKSPVNTKPSRVQQSIVKTLKKKLKPFKGTIPHYRNQKIQKGSPTSAEKLRQEEFNLTKEKHRELKEKDKEIDRRMIKKQITAQQAHEEKNILYKKTERELKRGIQELQRKQRSAIAQTKAANAKNIINYRLQEARRNQLQRLLSLPEEPRNKTGLSQRNREITAYMSQLARNLPKTQPNVLGNLARSMGLNPTGTMGSLKRKPSPNSNTNSNSPNHKKKKN